MFCSKCSLIVRRSTREPDWDSGNAAIVYLSLTLYTYRLVTGTSLVLLKCGLGDWDCVGQRHDRGRWYVDTKKLEIGLPRTASCLWRRFIHINDCMICPIRYTAYIILLLAATRERWPLVNMGSDREQELKTRVHTYPIRLAAPTRSEGAKPRRLLSGS